MNISQKLLAGAVVASMAVGVAPVVNAEVSASVGVASTYLWRGKDLGSGTPAVSGSLDYSASGFYAGIWGSSGDTDSGTEYDLYLGYGGSVGGFSYDVSAWTYSYPTGQYKEDLGTPGNLAEVVVGLGYGPVSFTYYDNVVNPVDAGEDYTYMTLAVELQSWTFLYGQHDKGIDDLSHFDISYGYNDNLTFTLSSPIDSDLEEDADPTFVVSYSIPIE